MNLNIKAIVSLATCATLATFCLISWKTHKVACYVPAEITKKRTRNKLGDCAKCNMPLRKINGKFGEFIGCSGYPNCKYIQRQQASFCCPTCTGSIEKRFWSGGILWGCSNYPNCRYAIFSDISDTPCTKCNANPYLLKKADQSGKIYLICANESCKHCYSA